MGVAEHAGREELRMGANLRIGVQAAARVVEIDLSVAVEASVIGRPAADRSRR